MKRKMWLILSIIFAMVSVLSMAVACGEDPVVDVPPEPSAEQGEYYYSAGSEDYNLELILGNTFTLKIKGENLSGKYVLDGEQLTFTDEGGKVLSATYRNDVVVITYETDTYRFLRKMNYTVNFQSNGGTEVSPATVLNGKTVQKPTDPKKDELVFVGWYTENSFRNLFSFTQPITGNLTLYARFVERIDPEFTVSFDVNGAEIEPIPAQETVGHKLFNLPTPEWEGHTFAGWWMSHYGSAEMPTAKYTEQEIAESITLYAIWDPIAPTISVSEKKITWSGRSGNVSYKVAVIGPEGEELVSTTVGSAEYDFDFAAKEAGDYIVTVTMDGKTGTAYYKNRGLSPVTEFKVTETTLFFNSVPNATNYLLTVQCGSADHSHVDIDLGTETSWDFGECDMTDKGITFTVKATAENYMTSVSKPWTFSRDLKPVANLKVDAAKDVVTWDAVENATGYIISVTIDGESVYNAKVDEVSAIDLQYYQAGEVVVTIVPKAFGWVSPAATELTYTKTHLPTPTNARLDGSVVEWDAVAGAKGYEVTFDGQTYQVTTNSFELKEEYYDATQSSYDFTVCALGATAAENSLTMPVFTIRNGQMSEISYTAGSVVWDAVFGIKTFLVKINDGEAVEVSGTSFAVTLPQKGENTISVCAVAKDGTQSEWKTIKVTAYEIAFDAQGGTDIAPLYLVHGDPLTLPQAERYGYTFNNWFTEPDGKGKVYDATSFQGEYDRTVYAAWTANKYKITFNAGTLGDGPYDENGELVTSVEVTFGNAFQLPVPNSKELLYAFGGWYGAGVRYTDFKGNSTSAFLYAGNITLDASYESVFSFKQNENGEWSVSKGRGIGYVTEVTVPIMYNNKLVSFVQDFTDCVTLETINIPNSIKNIVLASDGAAFQGCDALKNINIYESGIPADVVYYSVDGVLFYYNAAADGGRMEIKYYPYARPETEYTIPGTIKYGPNDEDVYYVSAIPSGAFRAAKFSSSELTRINIPATVSLIELHAFYFFYDLAELNFLPVQEGEVEAETLNIRKDAFGDPKESLSTARIRYVKLPKRLSENPREAFKNMTYLAYVDVEEGGTFSSVDGLLAQKSEHVNGALELVYYPRNRQLDENGKAVIPEDFSTTNVAREFRVPDEIYAIGEEAVKNNTKLKKIVIPGHVQYIGRSAFEGVYLIEELIFEGEKEDNDLVIEERAFLGEYWNENKPSNLPDNYTWNLTSLTLPANLTKLGRSAFGSVTGNGLAQGKGLREVTVNVDRTAEQIDFAAGAFTGTVPGAASCKSHINVLRFGPGVPTFEILDVFGADVKEVYVDDNNPNYWSDPDTGVLYDGAREKLIVFPASWQGPYTIPEGITNIQSGMFKERTGLTEIVIHKNVTRIGDKAFYKCTALTKAVFEAGGTEPLTIEESAFEECEVLSNVTLPERLVKLGNHAFKDCIALTAIQLPRDLQTLEMNGIYGDMRVFDGCESLKDLTVAEGNKYFKFDGGVLYTLRNAKLTPDGAVTQVPDRVIYVPGGVTGEIRVSGYIRSVGAIAFGRSSAFDDKLQITKIYFEDAITTYDPETGEAQSNDIDFNPHNGTSTSSPFQNLSQLTEIRFPKGMTIMPAYLVSYNCNNLEKVNVPVTVTSIDPYTFTTAGGKIKEFIFDESDNPEEVKPLRIEDHREIIPDSGSHAPNYFSLFGHMSLLKTIKFPARLTYLGSYAFYNMEGSYGTTSYSYVENIEFAETSLFGLTLGQRAFANTKNLKTVKLPKDLVEISNYAFQSSGIESIEIPEGIQKIGDYAFSSCTKLTSATIPSAVKSIGSSAFSSTKLPAINLHEGLETIGDSAFSGVSTLEGELRLPASLISIGNKAFYGTRFTKIITVADNKLATIGNDAFGSNPALTAVEFGKTNTPLTFGKTVFNGDTLLTSFTFPANVVEIGASMFEGFTTIKTIAFAPEVSLLETVNTLAFSKTGISEISFPESSAANGIALKANLFKSCTEFTKMHLSASISSIDGVLGGCASIKTITIDPNNTSIEADETLPVIYAKGPNGERGAILLVYGSLSGAQPFVVAPGTTVIGASAFANQTDIKIVQLPASVREIGDYAFQNCVNLEKVIIPNDSVLTRIGSGAFMNCWNLESINLENAANLQEFGDGTYSSSVSANHNGVFMFAGIHSKNPLKITFPASVKTLGTYMFTNSGVAEIDMSAATQITELQKGSYTGSGVNVYGYGLFSGSRKLTSVKLPDTITFLGVGTFSNCTALTTLDFTNLKSLKFVGDKPNVKPSASTYAYLFTRCTSLTEVKFPTKADGTAILEGLGGKCFMGCDNLTTITGIGSETFLAQYAYAGAGIGSVTISSAPSNYMFMGCKNLTSVTFDDSITSITATYLFQDSGLTSIDLSNTSITTLPNYMFDGCSKLTSVSFPATLTATGTYTFRNCAALTKVDLSGCTSLTRIGTKNATDKVTISTSGYTFQGCTSLKEVVLPDSCELLAARTFENCTSLDTINLGNVTLLGDYCFKNTGFTEVTIPSSVNTAFGKELFMNCEKLTKVTIPATTAITASSIGGSSMFEACPNLTTIEFNAFSGKTLPSSMFEACTGLTTVDMTNFTGSFSSYMFDGCTSLTTVTMPKSFNGLGSYMFRKTAIESIDLSGYKGTSLGSSMFRDCANLSEVTLSSSINFLNTYTFQNCTSLTSIDISNTKIDRFASSYNGNISSSTSVYLFDGCVNLEEVKTRPGQIVQIGAYTFRNCEKLTSFDISAVTRLSANAFLNAGISGKVTLPASLEYYYVSSNNYAFTGCTGITEFEVAEGCQVDGLVAMSGALVDSTTGTILHLPGGATVEGGVLDLNDAKFAQAKFGVYMFSGVSGIQKVILPTTMTELPAYMFYNSGVKEVVLPAGLTSIGNNAFQNSALKKIEIPATVESIGTGAFADTYQLETVIFLEPAAGTEVVPLTFAKGATTASANTLGVFRNSAIKNITLPGRMAKLAEGTFHYSAVETVTLSEGTTEIGDAAFAYATSLKTVNMPASVTELGNYVYAYTNITNLMLGDGVTTIGNYVYSYVETLGDLKPADFKNLTTIGTNTFVYTTNIKNVEFSEKIVNIGMSSFQNSNVERVKFPGTMEVIGNYMFRNCEHLDSVVIEDTAEGVERSLSLSGMFDDSTIKSAVIGEGVVSISGIFKNCENLESVKLPESLTNIGTETFRNCKKLKSVVIYDNIATIALGSTSTSYSDGEGTGPFAGWTSEQTIYFTASRSYIAALVGLEWINNMANMLKANMVFDYVPAA